MINSNYNMTKQEKIALSGMNKEQISDLLSEMNEPSYRADQIFHWVYVKSANTFAEMTNVSKSLKVKLENRAVITSTKIVQRQMSNDGTIKYLLEFPDGNRVETVLMRFDNRPNLTACVSTQVGCSIKCIFCATGTKGFIRNLTSSEIIDQVLTIQRDTGLRITNIVFMGQGEPLLNYDNLSLAINMFNKSMEIGSRRVTVSTCGIIPYIEKIGHDFPQLTLAVSLHAGSSELRKKLIPVEHKYNINSLIEALKRYYQLTKRRITIEYVLIKDLNDSLHEAKKLNELLKDLHCNINLIPYNSIDDESGLAEPSEDQVKIFKYAIELSGKKVTVRLKRGDDISAACGQLSGEYNE